VPRHGWETSQACCIILGGARADHASRSHTERVESRSERLGGTVASTGLYTAAFSLVALLVVLIALVVANARQVKLSWAVGSGHASLIWIIVCERRAWLAAGIVTSVAFRFRTRRRLVRASRSDSTR